MRRSMYLKGGVGRKGAKKVNMPVCEYDAACTRPGCVYRHPSRKKKGKDVKKCKGTSTLSAASGTFVPGQGTASYEEDDYSSAVPVCVQYLMGACAFGSYCRNRHLHGDAAEAFFEKAASTPCRFGGRCRNTDCLYFHPDEIIVPPPAPVVATPAALPPTENWPKSRTLVEKLEACSLSQPSSLTEVNDNASSAKKNVLIPEHLWVNDYERNPAWFTIPDPIDRFQMVNSKLGVGVADLHFQSKETVVSVLKRLFWHESPLAKQVWGGLDQLWIITGTGHHSKGTERGNASLYKCVTEFLDAAGVDYKIGKDKAGNGGAFLVEKEKQGA